MLRFRPTVVALAVGIVCTPARAGRMPSSGPELNDACARFEREVGSLDSEEYAPPTVAPEKNAAIPVAEAIASLKLTADDKQAVGDLAFAPMTSWTEEQLSLIRGILDRNAHALDRARAAVGRSGAHMDIDHRNPGHGAAPKVFELMALGELLVIDGRLTLESGADRRVVENSQALATIARVMGSEPRILEALVSRQAESFQLLLVRRALETDALGRTALQELDQTIRDSDLRKSLERSLIYELITKLRMAGATSTPAGQDAEMTRYDAIFGAYVDRVRTAVLRIRRGLAPDIPGGDGAWPDDKDSASPSKEEEALRSILLGGPVDLGQWSRIRLLIDARRLAHAAIAVRSEGLIAGRYPRSLDGVVADCDGLSYERRSDGSAVIVATDAQKLNDEIMTSGGLFRDGGLTWVLPPLADPSDKH